QYKGRKSKTKYLNNNQVDFVKYNGDNKIVRHKTKRKSIDGKWDVWIVRHTYNGDGLIVKSTQTKNGKENSIVNIIYKDGLEVKEIRTTIFEYKTVRTTNYQYE